MQTKQAVLSWPELVCEEPGCTWPQHRVSFYLILLLPKVLLVVVVVPTISDEELQ